MNPHGSYRKLLGNSKQAMLAAIEIYNKPRLDYREAVFVILLINAWQLLFLSILSKNKRRIFQKKEKQKVLKVHSFDASMNKATQYLSKEISGKAFEKNLIFLYKYRNSATHYYNEDNIAHCVHILIQANILNYRDVVKEIFHKDIASETNLVLPPFSFNQQLNSIDFLKDAEEKNNNLFVKELLEAMKDMDDESNPNRFLINYKLKLESKKQLENADAVVGIDSNIQNANVLFQRQDPNNTHPYGKKDILEKLQETRKDINGYVFEAICYFYTLKNHQNNKYAWKLNTGSSPWRYNSEIVKFIQNVPECDIEKIKKSYRQKKHWLD